jgi:hypothetical protein
MDEPSPRDALKVGRSGRRWLCAGLSGLAIVFGVIWFKAPWKSPRNQSASEAEDVSFPLPPVSESPFLNTKLDVGYVGTDSCRDCHSAHAAAFLDTSMGRSMSEVELAREPSDGEFDHPLSNRRYEVRRRDGRLWHRELLLADGPDEVVLSEFPVKYVVGSGHHSLTYLVETDGFLVESPITW